MQLREAMQRVVAEKDRYKVSFETLLTWVFIRSS
jgi:hypothetical protein